MLSPPSRLPEDSVCFTQRRDRTAVAQAQEIDGTISSSAAPSRSHAAKQKKGKQKKKGGIAAKVCIPES